MKNFVSKYISPHSFQIGIGLNSVASDSHNLTEQRKGILNPEWGREEVGWGGRSDTWDVSQKSIWIRTTRQAGRGRGSSQTDSTSCANCGEVVRERNPLVKILIIHCYIIYHPHIYDLKQQWSLTLLITNVQIDQDVLDIAYLCFMWH